MFWLLARSAAELLTSEQLSRVRVCASETCGWLFIDTSKNRTRRWCSMSDCDDRPRCGAFEHGHSRHFGACNGRGALQEG
jgi:predicted RNA-binding Zn ribbon-like protein